MMRGVHLLLGSFVVAAAVSGCGASKAARFYTLGVAATPGTAAATRYAVMVGPVSVPPAVDRPQFRHGRAIGR